ncbi:hypothetical protein ACFQ1E_17655 [Sphingomonas canadensis]|uniref:Integral membrane protein n=1 Tax=Sphingomonas canadensis TaxID=1219257 RepID=A0ABW3HF70_9SPHN|nr:hypothetical protein [Sphingomonas canadensis]MCW3837873.1 hypothetical protein [Sphingomonas canadensis]
MDRQLPAARIAFAVAAGAGLLGLFSLLGPQAHGLIAGALAIGAALVLLGSPPRGRDAARGWLRRGGLLIGAWAVAAAFWFGLMDMLATPLLVLAAVCAALGAVAVLGSPEGPGADNDDYPG